MIHETAIIHPNAKLASDVSVGAYSFIGEGVEIGSGCIIESHVVIKGPAFIGKNNRFFQFGSIGEECQDKKYAGEVTRLEIGDNNIFRECVTIHRGTIQDQCVTKIGSNNLFMAYVHVAHDCVVGNDNILANNATIAGHVHVGDHVILGGTTAVHQFCHIGSHSFTGGGCIVLRDIPPYVMVNGIDNTPAGINSEGLRRRGFDKDVIMQIKRAYKVLYRSGHRAEEAVVKLREMAEHTSEISVLAEFVADSSRGIVR